MLEVKGLKLLKTIEGLDYYLYKPSLGHWFFEGWDGFAEDTEKHARKQKIRMFIEYLWGGYSIYYAADSTRLVGYVLVASGGKRITCSCKDDIVLGPYYILKEMRGKGLCPKMLHAVLHELDIPYNDAYCYIKKNNTASLKAAAKCGFEIIGHAEIKGLLRKLVLTENSGSMFYIVRYGQEA